MVQPDEQGALMIYNLAQSDIKDGSRDQLEWIKGQKLFEAGKVGILSGWETPSIHTTIMDDKMCEVRLGFSMDGTLESWACSFLHEDKAKGYCAHTVAAFIKMQSRQREQFLKATVQKQTDTEGVSSPSPW